MSLLITGGAGYIGSHAALHAVRDLGESVVIVDNLSRGHAAALDDLARATGHKVAPADAPAGTSKLAFAKLDLQDTAQLAELMRLHQVTEMIHFAALAAVGESVGQPLLYYRNNTQGTVSLLEAAAEAGVERMVFSSTCATYGVPDASRIPIAEDTPQDPINPYGASKLMVERVLSDYAHARNASASASPGKSKPFSYAALRYFNVAGCDAGGAVGERHDPETHLIPVILQCITGKRPEQNNALTVFGTDYHTPDGTCIRDYVHVSDLVAAHFAVMAQLRERKPTKGLIFNLGIGKGFSVREVIQSVERVTGKTVTVNYGPRREGDPPTLLADPRKIMSQTSWRPRYTELDEIVRTAWEWFRRQ